MSLTINWSVPGVESGLGNHKYIKPMLECQKTMLMTSYATFIPWSYTHIQLTVCWVLLTCVTLCWEMKRVADIDSLLVLYWLDWLLHHSKIWKLYFLQYALYRLAIWWNTEVWRDQTKRNMPYMVIHSSTPKWYKTVYIWPQIVDIGTMPFCFVFS